MFEHPGELFSEKKPEAQLCAPGSKPVQFVRN